MRADGLDLQMRHASGTFAFFATRSHRAVGGRDLIDKIDKLHNAREKHDVAFALPGFDDAQVATMSRPSPKPVAPIKAVRYHYYPTPNGKTPSSLMQDEDIDQP